MHLHQDFKPDIFQIALNIKNLSNVSPPQS
jgi:hypothetical protein